MTDITQIRARAYQVGFGDAVLLTFTYEKPVAGRLERHLLIDCGSSRDPWRGFKIDNVVTRVAEHTDGHLDALVATHRHKDHISGFSGAAAQATLRRLDPRWVVRPWTDDPTAAADAAGPVRPLDDGSRMFLTLMNGTQTFAAAVEKEFAKARSGPRRTLKDIAATQVPNRRALDFLDEIARAASRVDYAAAGDKLRGGSILPGVTITVLGPPTLKQVPDLSRQRRDDPGEYWFRSAEALAESHVSRGTFPKPAYRQLAGPDGLGTARWLLDRLDLQSVAGLLRIVRTFDEAVNNTSLVLLIEAGGQSLLFSGDAQIENWSHTLRRIEHPRNASLRAALANVDLYKVGHHGSRNGTPKSLHRLWAEERTAGPLSSLLSTMAGVHGHTNETAVPRSTLIDALGEVGVVLSTEGTERGPREWVDWVGSHP